jgi:hypothetical protein
MMMKVDNVKQCWNGAVNGRDEVTFTATKAETDELRNALAIVDKWQKQALKQVPSAKGADWTMVTYAVKTDKVIVGIETGACG